MPLASLFFDFRTEFMLSINNIHNTEVSDVFSRYSGDVHEKLMYLRQLIIEVANESNDINELEECLKWGQPSYLTKIGSTVRIDGRKPDQIIMYFHCKTKLVETFKELYRGVFQFEGNRALVFNINEKIPEDVLKHCIELSLTYKKIKHLPMLGV